MKRHPFPPSPINDALFKACAKGTFEEIRALLDQGANPALPHWEEAWCDGMLDFISSESIKSASLENIRALLECGYDPNWREDEWDNHGPLLIDVLDSERRALFMEFIAKS